MAADLLGRRTYLHFFKPEADKSYAHRTAHSYYHHGLKPMAGGYDPFGPISGTLFVNSLGFRDVSCVEVPPKSKQPRILLIGDSFTEGISVPFTETFAGILQAHGKKVGVDVQNAGVSSYFPSLAWSKLRYLHDVQKLKFESLVVFIDISDVRDELFHQLQPDGSCQRVESGPFEGDIQAQFLRRAKNREIKRWLEANIENNFILLGALVRNLWLVLDGDGKLTNSSEAEIISAELLEWPNHPQRHRELVDLGQDKAQQALDAILDFCRLHRIKMTLVAYPWPAQIRLAGKDHAAKEIWKTWAQQRQVPYVSLFEVFENAGLPEEVCQKFFIPGDCHWNAAGHRLVADFLLQEWPVYAP